MIRYVSAWVIVAIGVACASSPPPPVATAPAPSCTPSIAASMAASKPMPTTLLPGVGMSTAPPKPDEDVDDDVASGPTPNCAKDEDCWSKTCCPAKAPEECVHASKARKCAIIDVTCKPSPMHYTCICSDGACKGRLAPP